ncbi:MAG: proline--tRNA ligase [Azoarcus sp.]|jgi:prolyl-tRNA synthetase|nr:proline--tRNA ligase [Azoarcus sp.]
MRASQFHLNTLKEAPADAEVASHKLMLRAGMIRKVAAGIYDYMPLALRSIRKIEAIIRSELNRAGALEISMPLVQPAELWRESGRWDKMGPEMLKLRDRHERDFAFQPTSEEVVTDIARQELKSYRQLPRNFYQIQTKFRDERRPRFGVMRGREFIMKDGYSFDRDAEAAGKSYDTMFAAYRGIFERIGLAYRAVAADTGAIGGDRSHEFQVIADTGEDAIVYCPDSGYAANIELAEALPVLPARAAASAPLVKVATPGRETCAEVADFLGAPLASTVKSLALASDETDETGRIVETAIWLLLLRGDHELNEVKAGKIEGLGAGLRFASEAEIVDHFGSEPGYLGPIAPKKPVRIVADRTVARMADFICGANAAGYHYTGANWGRDLPEPDIVADIRNAVAGDPSPDGKGLLAIDRGIEVGHVFYLGDKYSRAMNATFLDIDGKPRFFEMGCYGIGVTRILGAAIEQNNDERGIVWPAAIAPFEAVVCAIGWGKSAAVRAEATRLYEALLAAGVDAILDDRDERPGVMFADWELIGVPYRLTVGERGLKEGIVEYQSRRGDEQAKLAPSEAADHVADRLRTALKGGIFLGQN